MYVFEPDNFTVGPANKDPQAQSMFFLQTSLLYTSENRQRMSRIHNYAVRTSKDLNEVYSSVDYQVLVASILRRKLPNFVSQLPLIDIQLEVINDFKKAFKAIASQTSSETQSSLLPYLALGFLGVLKSPVFQAHYINNCELRSQEQQCGLGCGSPNAAQQGLGRQHLQTRQPQLVQP